MSSALWWSVGRRRVLLTASTHTRCLSSVAARVDTLTPPASVNSIATSGTDIGKAGAAIRQVGSTRRVFLLDPHLTPTEIEGLAHRIRVLTKNGAINSVLIATSEDDDSDAIPTSARDVERETFYEVDLGYSEAHSGQHVWHVAGGYCPRTLYQQGLYQDEAQIQALLEGVQQLALATRGNEQTTKVPVITIPHGLVNDAGYALCMGSYVLATPDTCFSILNPSRGLSLDPIGLSYVLPRLGWEHGLPSADYPGVGFLLACTGYQATASDLMETGLATHYMDSLATLGTLERSLGAMLPWNQQTIVKPKPHFFGQAASKIDANASFRNVSVAELITAATTYQAAGGDLLVAPQYTARGEGDPSLELDPIPFHQDRESHLVNMAATFHNIFSRQQSLTSIMERLYEIGNRKAQDDEEQEGIALAQDLYTRLQRQSPLALRAVHRLLQLGAKQGETLESCMEREKRVQTKLLRMSDYHAWAEHALSHPEGQEPPFEGWKHKSPKDVTQEEVDELLS